MEVAVVPVVTAVVVVAVVVELVAGVEVGGAKIVAVEEEGAVVAGGTPGAPDAVFPILILFAESIINDRGLNE